MERRNFLACLPAGVLAAVLPGPTFAAAPVTRIGAAWRGPRASDPYFAGVLDADWEARSLRIRYAMPLPTRPHGLLPQPDGGLVVAAVRPGAWLMRCDGAGRIVTRHDLATEGENRLCGHVVERGGHLYTTETDWTTGRGVIAVREAKSLARVAVLETRGIDPHQLVFDGEDRLLVANGGVPRTPEDRKRDLEKMDSSLVRLDAASGALLGQWRLADPRLSMRHCAWSREPGTPGAMLGIAMQAEHASEGERAAAPLLATFDGSALSVPTQANDGVGYSGDIVAAHRGGFVLSSNQAGIAQLWHPALPDRLTPVVKMQEAYALAPWAGPEERGGVLVATALGLVRWHPAAQPLLLPWPQPMALDNHWTLIGQA